MAYLFPVDSKYELVGISPRRGSGDFVRVIAFQKPTGSKTWSYKGEAGSTGTATFLGYRLAYQGAAPARPVLISIADPTQTLEKPNDASATDWNRALSQAKKMVDIINAGEEASPVFPERTISTKWYGFVPPLTDLEKKSYEFHVGGVVDNSYFSQAPFTSCHFPLHRYSTGTSSPLLERDLDTIERWLLGYSTVNNMTFGSSTGSDSFGATVLITERTVENGVPNIYYYTVFGGLIKPKGAQVKSTADPVHYGFQPELDFGLFNLPGLEEVGKVRSAIPSWITMTPPQLDNDKTYGLSQSTDIKIGLGSSHNNPTLDISGQNSFQHDYYTVAGSLQESFGDAGSLTEKGGYQAKPKNTSVEDDTTGGLTYHLDLGEKSCEIHPDAVEFTLDLSPTFTAKDYQSVTTDEYAFAITPQITYDFLNGAPKNKTTAADFGPDGEIDGTAWLTPTESSSGPFYSNAVGKVHVGSDVPVTDWPGYDSEDESSKFIRYDLGIMGGGVLGKVPNTADYFYGGNNLSEGLVSSMPSPIIRSIGSGQAAVYPLHGTKTNGADSYASVNFTTALPVPFLSYGYPLVRDPNDVARVENGLPPCDGTSKPTQDRSIEQDKMDFLANDFGIAFKPLIACDAAWLGAPSGFRDRSLVSLAGGGELSVGAVNFDLLYAVTLSDSAHQNNGENIIFQATYDFHF